MPSLVVPNPVTPAEVAREVGANPTDQRVIDATDAAWDLVLSYLDWQDDQEGLPPDPMPMAVRRATIGVAVDNFRAMGTAFGYFVNDVGIASTGMDLLRRWRTQLDPYKTAWGMA